MERPVLQVAEVEIGLFRTVTFERYEVEGVFVVGEEIQNFLYQALNFRSRPES